MTQEELKAIKAQCESMAMQAKCFRKVISNIDPVANSPMTDTNIPIKVLADWARNACDTIARKDLPDCRDEIERLQKRLERFKWIADQPCERFDENGQSDCDQTGDCITEWCFPCYSKKALEE